VKAVMDGVGGAAQTKRGLRPSHHPLGGRGSVRAANHLEIEVLSEGEPPSEPV
jgi:hypothetical protein